jgi:hypothetical protein
MGTIGVDAEVLIDGNPFFLKPLSYVCSQPRIRKATVRADGGEAYVDLGPGKRIWHMTVLCVNDLTTYSGTSTGISGQQYRDALRSAYTTSTGTTVNFVDPLNGLAVPVHFDSFEERILDMRSQIISVATGGSATATYEVTITLREA